MPKFANGAMGTKGGARHHATVSPLRWPRAGWCDDKISAVIGSIYGPTWLPT